MLLGQWTGHNLAGHLGYEAMGLTIRFKLASQISNVGQGATGQAHLCKHMFSMAMSEYGICCGKKQLEIVLLN